MTLGGLALAIGILVDEATVEIENIHHKMEETDSVALAVRQGNMDTAVPRLLAMLCILAVFLPSFFMQGAAQALFVPLSLAVGFAMVCLLSAVEHVRSGALHMAAPPPTCNDWAPAEIPFRSNCYEPMDAGCRRRPLAMVGHAGLPGLWPLRDRWHWP